MQGNLSGHDWKNVDWDVKNQIKKMVIKNEFLFLNTGNAVALW